jgi:hypothetical protein
MFRHAVLSAALVAFAAPAFAEEAVKEASAKTETPAPVEAAATPTSTTTAETVPGTKVRYSGSKSGGCMFSASAPMS